jgi:hypothetical protein
MPYSMALPQADRDIWLQYDDLLGSSLHICGQVLLGAKDNPTMREQIERTGADLYLHTLINLDTEARRWIGKIIAGET